MQTRLVFRRIVTQAIIFAQDPGRKEARQELSCLTQPPLLRQFVQQTLLIF
jgi:hypothetical protein